MYLCVQIISFIYYQNQLYHMKFSTLVTKYKKKNNDKILKWLHFYSVIPKSIRSQSIYWSIELLKITLKIITFLKS